MPLVLLVALLVLQGGYAPAVSSLAALALCAFGLFSLVDARRTGTKASLLVILPAAIPLLYLVSALFHGVSYSGLEAGGRWSLFAVGIILSATMASTRRQWLFQSVAWIGVVSSALGLVMADSAFQFLGWSNAGRLQFLFQYANTAGIWFSVVAVLSWFSESCLLRRLVYLPISCLLLTQSGGSLALSSIALVPMAVMGFRRWGAKALISLELQLVCAIVIFFACGASSVLGVLFAGAFGVAACLLGRRHNAASRKPSGDHVLLAVLIAVLLVVFGVGLLIFLLVSGRLVQASQTMIERIVQIFDGFGLVARSPLLGIGPDGWRYAYREVQSAQYTANAIHCGYLQIVLDAGVMPLVVFIVVAGSALRGFCRAALFSSEGQRPPGDKVGDSWCAWGLFVSADLLLAHALIDIDFQFGLVLVLLALLLGEGLSHVRFGEAFERPLVASCLFLVALLGAVACWAGGAKASALARLAEVGDSRAISAVATDPLAAGDVGLQTEILRAYCDLGEPERATIFAELHELPRSGEQALIIGRCYYALGDRDAAEGVLLGGLEREPLYIELYEAVAQLFDTYGASEDALARYNGIAGWADGLGDGGLAPLLYNQREIPRLH